MKRWIVGVLTVFLVSCVVASGKDNVNSNEDPLAVQPSQELQEPTKAPALAEGDPDGETQPAQAVLEDYGPAPELTNEVWLNSDHPLQLADLRGKVVLIDMWTFG